MTSITAQKAIRRMGYPDKSGTLTRKKRKINRPAPKGFGAIAKVTPCPD